MDDGKVAADPPIVAFACASDAVAIVVVLAQLYTTWPVAGPVNST